jgi:O-antigen ligase
MKMLTLFNDLKRKHSLDTISILLFVLVTCCFPFGYKKVIPLFIGLSLFQLFRLIKSKASFNDMSQLYFYLLVYSLIFFRSIHTIILGFNILIYIYAFITTKANKEKRINYKIELLIFIFFILILLNQTLFLPRFETLSTYLYILFYPILFYCIKMKKGFISIRKSMEVFIVSTLVSSILLILINGFYKKLSLTTNTFFAEYLGLSHVYFGIFLGASCVFLLMLSKGKNCNFNKWTLLLLGFFMSLLIYVGARMSLLAVFFAIGVFLFENTPLVWYKKTFISIFVLGTFLILAYKIVPRAKDDMKFFKKVYTSVKSNDQQDIITNSWRNIYQRYLVTKYTLSEIKKQPVLGIGIQNVKRKIGDQIHADGYKYFTKINPHNQYLHYLLGMGFFSFLFFIGMLLYLFKLQSKNVYFLLFFVLIMITESVLVRVKGISVFFLFSLIISLNKECLND